MSDLQFRLVIAATFMSLLACNNQERAATEDTSLTIPRVDLSHGIPGPPSPPVVQFSGTLHAMLDSSGALYPGAGQIILEIADNAGRTVSNHTALSGTDGRWAMDVPTHCSTCSYTVRLDLPKGFVPDQESLPFLVGRRFSWSEFSDFSHGEVAMKAVEAEDMAYLAFQMVAPPLYPEFDPGSRVYELSVLAADYHELMDDECIYVYTDVLVRIDYYIDGKPVVDYEVEAREVYDEEGFSCSAVVTPPFRVGIAARHSEEEGLGISSWDSMTIVYLKDEPEGQYFFAEGDTLFLDGELVGKGSL